MPPQTGKRDGRGGGESLLPAIQAALAELGVRPSEIAEVICGSGPGSFTSRRIAASIAKGISSASGAPLFAVSSLMLTVAGRGEQPRPGNYLSVLPAMRGESFAQSISVGADSSMEAAGPPRIIPDEALESAGAADQATLIGPTRAIDALPHARGIARLLGQIRAQGPVDLDSWEPNYGRLAEAQVRWA